MQLTVVPLLLLLISNSSAKTKFPKDFLFGAASSAYQIEGGYTTRGQTILDAHITENPSIIIDGSNAKIACDSYNLYREDVALLNDLGVDFYRFSISWSRILPTGLSNQINLEGIKYYKDLIDDLISKQIEPIVTIFHYDMPKKLQDLGGWTNPYLAELYLDYARIVFENFGDSVKYWITFNVEDWGYGDDVFPPRINQSGFADYLGVKTILVAHAKTYHLYQKRFKESQQGQVGITVNELWFEPGSDLSQDLKAAERAREFVTGLLLNPLHQGDFPEVVKKRVDEMSKKEGFARSRLPHFSDQEKKLLKKSYDFIGLNIYTTLLVEEDFSKDDSKEFSGDKDKGVRTFSDPKWEGASSSWLKVVPWGARKGLKWISEKYGYPRILITENGFSDRGELNDLDRIRFLEKYLESILEAIEEDAVNVFGYAVWSLLDNFEWQMGYTEKFGLYHVDFSDPARPRTPKASAKWYKNFLKSRELSGRLKTEL